MKNSSESLEFGEKLNSCRKILISAAESFLRKAHEAEDVVQKASVIMWNKYNTFDKNTDFVKWAYTIVALVARNANRSMLAAPVVQDQELYDIRSESWKTEQDHNTHLKLEETLEKLDSDERALLEAVYIDGERIDEYARVQGKPRQTVYNQLCEIKKRIKL